ncbi:hypothetical protein H6G74_15865 [Nostoc spongiaeforme FACHB-130]|uniref:Uncharacterized protein n=1 Tax=Nostoc spongiaeforme FACHB-130 TaxID=1357510 RepID=A0ABR8FZ71_9NOSO|nr:hypothetical protein [Nostoc spongiaeforme]MBD2595795.1 hypothetical protein [Nostoc spongiaeforme FACHB-130]
MLHQAFSNKQIKNLTATAVFAFISLFTSVVRAEDDRSYIYEVKNQLLERAEIAGLGGYTLTHKPSIDTLREGRSHYININLRAGMSYGIVGVCDSDCQDLDISLYDHRGNLIASDLQDDDIPVISLNPSRSGRYQIQVDMANCNANTCYYGIGVFGQ